MATLHLVPVPIAQSGMDAAGVAAALPAPTIGAARACAYFLAEDARSARAFLKAAGHPQAIARLHIVEIGHAPDPARFDEWLAPLRPAPGRDAIDAVLLAEAGCPCIADPGGALVARAHELGIAVAPWVGPCAIVLALMAAGMNGNRFRFLGYLPQERAALHAHLLALQRDAERGETQIFIETPYRNARLFASMLEVCRPELQLCVAVDLGGPAQTVSTRSVARWRAGAAATARSLERRPAVFLLCGRDAERGSGGRSGASKARAKPRA